MRNGEYVKVTKQEYQETSITCDVCDKIYDVENDPFETQEFTHIHMDCGYDSVFGDGSMIDIDICQHCLKSLVGNKVRVTEPYGLSEQTKLLLSKIKRIERK